MTHSRRKTPIVGNKGAPSDKRFKRQEHGRERAGVRVALAGGAEPPHPRLFGDPCGSAKDGKAYVAGRPELLNK